MRLKSPYGWLDRAAQQQSVDSTWSACRAVDISNLRAAHPNALKTADTTAGTIPSSMKEGMKQIIIGSTLRTPTARARA
jgi:hypothetical protein